MLSTPLKGTFDDLLMEGNTADETPSVEALESCGIVPGSAKAQQYWEQVELEASRNGGYGGRSLEFGDGGLSKLLHDKLVVTKGIGSDAAELIVRLNYTTQAKKAGFI